MDAQQIEEFLNGEREQGDYLQLADGWYAVWHDGKWYVGQYHLSLS